MKAILFIDQYEFPTQLYATPKDFWARFNSCREHDEFFAIMKNKFVNPNKVDYVVFEDLGIVKEGYP